MHEGLGQLRALLHARRVGVDGPIARFAEPDVVEHLVRAADGFVTGHAGQLAREGHERGRGHGRNVAIDFRHVADPAPHLEGRRRGIEAEGHEAAGIGPQEPQQRLEQRGLARSVGTQQAEDAPVTPERATREP